MVAHAYKCRGSCNQFFVDRRFVFPIQRTGGFVQQHVTRVFQEYSCERQALALADREDFVKIEIGIKAATPLDQTAQMHEIEHLTKLFVRRNSIEIRIIQLNSKASDCQVGVLRKE